MSSLFYKTLLDDFSRDMKMQPLAFDDKGVCNMIVDETFALTLLCDGIHDRLLLIGLLEPPEDLPLQRLLAGALNPLVNAGPGPGIGWDEHSGMYHAYQSIPREHVSVAALKHEIAGLVEWMSGWREPCQ